jgi:REP element-mobilizing transposase RayT
MSNHIHFLIRVKTEPEIEETFGTFQTFQKLEARISKQFSNLFSSYTQAFNKMYQRRGSLFMQNFKRKEITSDEYFTTAIVYIHRNPVNHGFTTDCASYRWSSYSLILSDVETIVKREEVINWFGDKDRFMRAHLGTQEDCNFPKV